MKCDMCYDRTSQGLKPMCASVCPSQALFFGTAAEVEALRPNSRAVDSFQFGAQIVTTRVKIMVPESFADDHAGGLGAARAGRRRRAGGSPARQSRTRSRSRERAGDLGAVDPGAGRTSDGGAAEVAAGLPDRRRTGPVLRTPRVHQVPHAHQLRVRRGAGLDPGQELAAEANGIPRARGRAARRPPGGRLARLRLSDRGGDQAAGARWATAS